MTKPTTESGAPIEFDADGAHFALRAQSYGSWPWQYRAATTADLVAALRANDELRAQVLAQLPEYTEAEDSSQYNGGVAADEHVKRRRAESELAKCRAELERVLVRSRSLVNAMMICDVDGAEVKRAHNALQATVDAHEDMKAEAVNRVNAPATGDQEAAAGEPPRHRLNEYTFCTRCKRFDPSGSCTGEAAAGEPSPPEAPKLPGGLGPVDTLRAEVVSAARRASHRGYLRDDAQNALQSLADELERGRQR